MINNKNFKSRWVNQLVDNVYIGMIVVHSRLNEFMFKLLLKKEIVFHLELKVDS